MFLTNFQCREDIIKEYAGTKYYDKQTNLVQALEKPIREWLENSIIHLAWYDYSNYQGRSLVIFEKNFNLYSVSGSHCSCYGLEGQWRPCETSWDCILKEANYLIDDEYQQDIGIYLRSIVEEHLKNAIK